MVEYHEPFDVLFRELMDHRTIGDEVKERFGIPEDLIIESKRVYVTTIPSTHSVFEFKYIQEGRGLWKTWSELVPAMPKDSAVNEVIVPTVETARYFYLLQLLVQHQKPVLLVGPTGTGKSAYTMYFLLKMNDVTKYDPLFVTFSAQTTANQTQDTIISKMVRLKKGVYGAAPGKYSVIFVDDISMPQKEEYGAQPPIELLRQWLDHYTWYDRKEVAPISLQNMQLICTMPPPSSGRDVTERCDPMNLYFCLSFFSIAQCFLVLKSYLRCRF